MTRSFVDTNVFVYSQDSSAPEKQARASTLLTSLGRSQLLVISPQVIVEFFHVLRRKFGLETLAAHRAASALLAFEVVHQNSNVVEDALNLAALQGLSIWDSMIVAAALSARCETLYTEALQHGLSIRGLRIENPFSFL
jgi:predicted nucleic acid-binding protein